MILERIFGFISSFELELKNKECKSKIGDYLLIVNKPNGIKTWGTYQTHKHSNDLSEYQIVKVFTSR
jgi:hypothetical protein